MWTLIRFVTSLLPECLATFEYLKNVSLFKALQRACLIGYFKEDGERGGRVQSTDPPG